MDAQELKKIIDQEVPGAFLESRYFGRSNTSSIWIEMSNLFGVANAFRHHSRLEFDWLENMSAMQMDDALVLTYFLRKAPKEQVVLRGSIVPQSRTDKVSVSSVSKIWSTAPQFESEIADLFGVDFTEQEYPDVRIQKVRTLLPDYWVGFPLRKTYEMPGSDWQKILERDAFSKAIVGHA